MAHTLTELNKNIDSFHYTNLNFGVCYLPAPKNKTSSSVGYSDNSGVPNRTHICLQWIINPVLEQEGKQQPALALWTIHQPEKQGVTKTRAGRRSWEEFWPMQALGPSGFFPQATTHHWTLCYKSNSSPEEMTVMLSELFPWAHPAPALQDKCRWMSMGYSHQCGKGAVFCCTVLSGKQIIPHVWLLHTVIEKSRGMILAFTGHAACKCCFPLTQMLPCICIWFSKDANRLYAIVSASESGVTHKK